MFLLIILSPLQFRGCLLGRARPVLDEVNVCLDPTISAAYSGSVGLSNGNYESHKF
jgi:hypothetical protein